MNTQTVELVTHANLFYSCYFATHTVALASLMKNKMLCIQYLPRIYFELWYSLLKFGLSSA